MVWLCILVLVIFSCLPCFGAATAPAKQGDLSGAGIQWFYGSYGQLGSRGFFGDYNVDASSTGGFLRLLTVGYAALGRIYPNP